MFSRLSLLIGEQALQRLSNARILLLGIGGVGSWAAEALVRGGIGHLTIVDFDTVSTSNLNRQLLALHSTIGRLKTDVLSERLKDINPNLDLSALPWHLTTENIPPLLNQTPWDYVIDAIDEREPKLALLTECVQKHIPVISSMGAAEKLSTDGLQITDISKTSMCRMARRLRKELRERGISHGITVVTSTAPSEPPRGELPETAAFSRRPLGTISFVPSAFGLKCAEHVIRSLVSDFLKQ